MKGFYYLKNMKFIPCDGGFWLVAETPIEERQIKEEKGRRFIAETHFATRRIVTKNTPPLLSLFFNREELE